MLQSKKNGEQMRKKVTDIYQSTKGYKTISEALGHQKPTVRAIFTDGESLKCDETSQEWLASQKILQEHIEDSSTVGGHKRSKATINLLFR